jgi:hypothetical protein
MTYIVYNAIKTPDGTILESKHRHDFRTHKDAVTGDTFLVDGGHDYLRRKLTSVPAEELSVTTEDSIERIREVFTWGSYGKNGDEPKKYILLKDMTDSHLCAILETQQHIKGTEVYNVFIREKQYRKDHAIQVL